MSQTYPDLQTAFPDNFDPNRNFKDVNITNKPYVDSYISAVSSGDFETATSIMSSHNDLKDIIINASVIQLLYDMNIANQRIYKSDFQTHIAKAIQYKGIYSNTTTYSFLNLVTLNYQGYMCFATSPITGISPTDTTNWVKMSFMGVSGTGMAFYTSFDNTHTYKVQDCLPYNNKLWVSIADNNLNHVPSDTSSYWKAVVTNSKQIEISSSQPVSQEIGDLWYELLS